MRAVIGLIYKDFAANKKMVFFSGLILFWFGFVTIVGNDIHSAISLFGMVMLYLGCAGFPENAMQSDKKSGWSAYALTLPAASKKTVLAKYLLMLGMYIFAFILAVILSLISVIILGHEFSIFPPLTILGFAITLDSITYAFIFRFGFKKGNTLKALFFLALPFAALMYLFFGDLTIFGEKGMADFIEWFIAFDFTEFIGKVWWVFILAGIISFTAGCFISGKAYRSGLEAE